MDNEIKCKFDTSNVDALALADEVGETQKCKIVDGRIIVPCADLGNALEDDDSLRMAQLCDKNIDVVILDDTGLIFTYCPFCGAEIFKEDSL